MLSVAPINMNVNSRHKVAFGNLNIDSPVRKALKEMTKEPEKKAFANEIKSALNIAKFVQKKDKTHFNISSFSLNSVPDSINLTISRLTKKSGIFSHWERQAPEEIKVSRRNMPEEILKYLKTAEEESITPIKG